MRGGGNSLQKDGFRRYFAGFTLVLFMFTLAYASDEPKPSAELRVALSDPFFPAELKKWMPGMDPLSQAVLHALLTSNSAPIDHVGLLATLRHSFPDLTAVQLRNRIDNVRKYTVRQYQRFCEGKALVVYGGEVREPIRLVLEDEGFLRRLREAAGKMEPTDRGIVIAILESRSGEFLDQKSLIEKIHADGGTVTYDQLNRKLLRWRKFLPELRLHTGPPALLQGVPFSICPETSSKKEIREAQELILRQKPAPGGGAMLRSGEPTTFSNGSAVIRTGMNNLEVNALSASLEKLSFLVEREWVPAGFIRDLSASDPLAIRGLAKLLYGMSDDALVTFLRPFNELRFENHEKAAAVIGPAAARPKNGGGGDRFALHLAEAALRMSPEELKEFLPEFRKLQNGSQSGADLCIAEIGGMARGSKARLFDIAVSLVQVALKMTAAEFPVFLADFGPFRASSVETSGLALRAIADSERDASGSIRPFADDILTIASRMSPAELESYLFEIRKLRVESPEKGAPLTREVAAWARGNEGSVKTFADGALKLAWDEIATVKRNAIVQLMTALRADAEMQEMTSMEIAREKEERRRIEREEWYRTLALSTLLSEATDASKRSEVMREILARLNGAPNAKAKLALMSELNRVVAGEAPPASGSMERFATGSSQFLAAFYLQALLHLAWDDRLDFGRFLDLLRDTDQHLLRYVTFSLGAGIGATGADAGSRMLREILERKLWLSRLGSPEGLSKWVAGKLGEAGLSSAAGRMGWASRMTRIQVGFICGVLLNKILWEKRSPNTSLFWKEAAGEVAGFWAATALVKGASHLAGPLVSLEKSGEGAIVSVKVARPILAAERAGEGAFRTVRVVRSVIQVGKFGTALGWVAAITELAVTLYLAPEITEFWAKGVEADDLNWRLYTHLREMKAFLAGGPAKKSIASVSRVTRTTSAWTPSTIEIENRYDMRCFATSKGDETRYGACWGEEIRALFDLYNRTLGLRKLKILLAEYPSKEMKLDATYGVVPIGSGFRIPPAGRDTKASYFAETTNLWKLYHEEEERELAKIVADLGEGGKGIHAKVKRLKNARLAVPEVCRSGDLSNCLQMWRSREKSYLDGVRDLTSDYRWERGEKEYSAFTRSGMGTPGIDWTGGKSPGELLDTVGYFLKTLPTPKDPARLEVQRLLKEDLTVWISDSVGEYLHEKGDPIPETDLTTEVVEGGVADIRGFTHTYDQIWKPWIEMQNPRYGPNFYGENRTWAFASESQKRSWRGYLEKYGSPQIYYGELANKSVSIILPPQGGDAASAVDRYLLKRVAGGAPEDSDRWFREEVVPHCRQKTGVSYDPRTAVEGMADLYRDCAAVIFQVYRREGLRSPISGRYFVENIDTWNISNEYFGCLQREMGSATENGRIRSPSDPAGNK